MTALALLAGCTGIVEPKNGSVESDPDSVRATEGKDAGRRDARVDAGSDQVVDEDDGDDAPNKTVDEPEAQLNGCAENEDYPLAQGLRIRELALYQTVKVPLFADGAWVTQRVAPVVQRKKALVRVFVDPQEGFRPHDVRAVLKLTNAGETVELIDERTIDAASTDAAL
ncbi:MAG: hypothetical protein ABW352_08515, partial [Polyangiales bacterium]